MAHQLGSQPNRIRPHDDFAVIRPVFPGDGGGERQLVEVGVPRSRWKKVFTGSLVCIVMEATTEVESIPPLKKAPRGRRK
jgi:hypothetical protein